jgi:hypothetical protein
LHRVLSHKLINLTQARNYYTVVSAAVSSLMTAGGLFLGFFYYFHKKEVEDFKGCTDRRRARISLIIDQLDKYDEYIDEILCKRVDSPARLDYLRGKIARAPEIINAMLENNQKISLGFTDSDVMKILQVFSFVDKCPEIRSYHYNTLQNGELKFLKSDFIDKIQLARTTCYLKTE